MGDRSPDKTSLRPESLSNDIPPASGSAHKPQPSQPSGFPKWLKSLLIVGTVFAILFAIIFYNYFLKAWVNLQVLEESETQDPSSGIGSVLETIPSTSAPKSSVASGTHSLRLAVIAPVERLIVMNEGGPFPGTNQRIREFKDLPAGWEGTLSFTDSFKCYCSSLENLRFFVDDGAEKQIEGEGSGKFTWPE